MIPFVAQDVLSGRADWGVLCWDNALLLPLLEEGAVAHVITDPPYDAKTHAGVRSHLDGGSPVDFAPLDGFGFVPGLIRVARRWVICFGALEDLGAYRDAAGAAWVRSGIWDRPNGAPQFTGDRPAQGCDALAIMHRPGKKAWNGGGNRAVWRCGIEREERHHPTPKPIALMLELVEQFTDPGDLVLDPFCGSGSTGVACLRLGRRFLGVELDPRYAQIAMDRLTAESQGVRLSDAMAGQLALFGGSAQDAPGSSTRPERPIPPRSTLAVPGANADAQDPFPEDSACP